VKTVRLAKALPSLIMFHGNEEGGLKEELWG
jgi:hypothetical protein